MSAVPQTTSLPPQPRGASAEDDWIDLDEAARRSGWSKGHIKRMCGHAKYAPAGVTLVSKGMARLVPSPNGGMPAWEVNANADARFARVKFPEQLSAEAAGQKARLPEHQRDQIDLRMRILRQWKEKRDAGRALSVPAKKIDKTFCEHLRVTENVSICPATLYNWQIAYRRGGELALLDGRSCGREAGAGEGDSPAGAADDRFLAFFQKLYLTPRKLSIDKCHEAAESMALLEGWPVRSYDQCKRHLRTIPPQLIVKMRDGEDAFVAKCEPAIERDYTRMASNDVWFADDHRFDVVVQVGTDSEGKPIHDRPFLCGWQDARSRLIVAWKIVAKDPNTETVLSSFEAGILQHGLPKWVYLDNGKHYDSLAVGGLTKKRRRARAEGDAPDPFCGAFPGLGVKVKHATPYHGQSKTIERFFRTVCERFAKLWETYCGNTPFTRPEDLSRQLDLGKAPTLAEFTQAFGEWLEADYHFRRHLGNGMGDTPAAVYQANLIEKRPVIPEIARFYCSPAFCPTRKRKDGSIERGVLVGKQGVTWQSLNFGAFSPAVQALFGQRVMLRINRDDTRYVMVCGLDGRLICKAPRNTSAGVVDENTEDVRSAIAEKGRLRRTRIRYQEARPRMSHDMHQLTADAGRRRRAANPAPRDPVPPVLKPVRTAVDDQLPVIQRAMNANKKAVGAENLDLDALRPLAPQFDRAPESADEDIDVFAAVSAAMRNQRGES
jgi:putative transposase